MQREPIQLRLDRSNDFGVAMTQRENSKTPEAIYEFAASYIAYDAAVAKPFDHGAGYRLWFRPAIQILIETLNRVVDEFALLRWRELVLGVEVHITNTGIWSARADTGKGTLPKLTDAVDARAHRVHYCHPERGPGKSAGETQRTIFLW